MILILCFKIECLMVVLDNYLFNYFWWYFFFFFIWCLLLSDVGEKKSDLLFRVLNRLYSWKGFLKFMVDWFIYNRKGKLSRFMIRIYF